MLSCGSDHSRAGIAPRTCWPSAGVDEFSYMACLNVFADGLEGRLRVAAAMNAELANVPQVRRGVSLLSRGGCVARRLAKSAADSTRTNRKLWTAVHELVAQLPPFDYREY
jgi:hypothetical protein